MLKQEDKNLKGLVLKVGTSPVGAEFARARVQLEFFEADAP
jgi:hypothetical protein